MVEPTKVCTVCLERKPWSAFYQTRTGNPRWACRQCESAIAAERLRRKRREQPEQQRALARRGYHQRKTDPEWWETRRAYNRDQANRRRRARGVPERTKRGRMGTGPQPTLALLDAEPFADWLRWVLDRDGVSIMDLSRRWGMSDRTLREVLHGQRKVDLVTVERVLVADDSATLDELYPYRETA